LCLAFVFAFGAANLLSDPIKTADYNSWKHIGITSGSPIFTIPQTLNNVAVHSSDHAPLYFMLLNIWGQIAGRDLATLRVLSLLFALLALAFTFRLALVTGGKGAALDAVILTTFTAYFLYYSLEVRMYSLLIMLTAWVAWAYWRVSISTARARSYHWAALVIGSAAIINVHYFGFLVLTSISLYHLLFSPKDRAWMKVPLALSAAGLFFLPWLPVALSSLSARSIPDHDVLSLVEALPAIGERPLPQYEIADRPALDPDGDLQAGVTRQLRGMGILEEDIRELAPELIEQTRSIAYGDGTTPGEAPDGAAE